MWRDRTNLFISYRQSYAHHPAKKSRYAGPSSNGYGDQSSLSEDRRGLLSAGAFEDDGDAIIEMDLLPPRWLDIQDEVTEHLTEIAKKTRQLEQLHQKHVLPGFDDEDVKKREEREIEKLTQEITRSFHSCQTAIKRIDGMLRESQQQGNLTSADETMAKNLKISLATRVGEVSALFRKKQAAYLKKLRAISGFASPLPGASTPVQNPYTDPSLMDSEVDRTISLNALQQTAQKREQKLISNPNETIIAQREREIEDIATGIIELSNIFQELQTMVIDQGTMLDRIDYNVEKMGEEVKGAEKELKVATNYQKRSVKRKIMLLLLLCIVGLFIVLGLKLGTRGGRKETSSPPTENPPVQPQGVPGDGAPFKMPRASSFDFRNENVRHRRDWRRRKREYDDR
ncbi:SNARE complex subunit Tlg2 [Rhizodiscina lignyota]|uniref:SNARE complex subunit Tlg2 n=1 Tax=Rhizodiscina lignyota TaxID=1504668 RepID=A0A9P4IFQ8_9PEZI|nr:SNARE complex subunit Tlg2 [Rhizodiscina lignyota]